MSLGCSLSLAPRQTLALKQGQYLYLELPQGELELLSLHRIKNRLNTMDVHAEVRRKIALGLIKRNAEDRKLNMHKRYSICIEDLDSTCDEVREFLGGHAESVANTYMQRGQPTYQRAREILIKSADGVDSKVRKWFVDNYDHLIYDTNSKIPWPIVRRMRANLEMWAIGNTSFFSEPVEDLVENLVKECGRNPNDFDSMEKMWDFLKTQR